jgi:putative transposase
MQECPRRSTSLRRSSPSCGRSTCWYRKAESVAEAVRSIGVTQFTYYRWRKEFGGLKTDQVKRLKELEKENERLRKAVSDLTLEKLILAEAARGNF